MAIFPSIPPTTRSYTFGVFPQSRTRVFGGGEVKFSHGSVPFGHVLDLGYELLSIDELEEIRAHYRGQDGGHRSFRIPASIWDGTDATMVPSTGRWKYGAEPAETQSRGTVHSCSVKIIYVGQDETS